MNVKNKQGKSRDMTSSSNAWFIEPVASRCGLRIKFKYHFIFRNIPRAVTDKMRPKLRAING